MKGVMLLGVIVAVMLFTGCWDMNQAIGTANGEAAAGGPAQHGGDLKREGGGT